MLSATSPLRVRPRHCDAQAMVHASRYYEFFEDAFLDWLDEHAGGYRHLRRQEGVDFVIVSSGCDYRRPAQLDDELTVESRAEHVGRTSLTMRFTVRRRDEELAIGHATYVAIRDGAAAPLPSSLRQ